MDLDVSDPQGALGLQESLAVTAELLGDILHLGEILRFHGCGGGSLPVQNAPVGSGFDMF
jgi:hypothetical protein